MVKSVMNNKLRIIALLIAVSISVVSIPSTHADSTSVQVGCVQPKKAAKDLGTLVLAGANAQLTSVQWGTEAGCFKKYGLTIKTVNVASSQIGIAGLIGRSFDLKMTTPTVLMLAMANGNFAGKIVAPRHGYSAEELARAKREPLYPGELLLQTALIVRKDSAITSWKDLQNRKIGLKTLQSQEQAGILLAMRAIGASTAKTQFLTVPDAQMQAALERGDVDAVVSSDPFATQIILAGGRIIGYPTAYYAEPGVTVAYVSSQDIVDKNLVAMRAFAKATLEINHLLNQPESDSSYRKVIAKLTGVNDEAAAKVRLPIMVEKSVTFSDIAYIPNKLKLLGFTRSRVNLAPILFR